MEIRFVSKKKIKIWGYSYKTTINNKNVKDIHAFWKDYMQSGKMKKLHKEKNVKSHNEYGFYYLGNSKPGDSEYIIGVEVKHSSKNNEYRYIEIPAAYYVVFSTMPLKEMNFAENMRKIWEYIFDKWLKETNHRINKNGISFEFYDEIAVPENNKVGEIYISIIKE
jgi:predicted transcriptional regulator YdeE